MPKINASVPSLLRFTMQILAVAVLMTGCIRSMVRITTQPDDARVTMNYVERGYTPVEIPILWYWYYKIRVEKDGFEPIEVDERFKAPAWAVPPFDLLADALPIPIKNTYYKHYVLQPKKSD